MRHISVLLAACALGAIATQAATISNPWSGVAGDKANVSAVAVRADAGLFPASVTPADSLTPTFLLNSITFSRPDDTVTPTYGTGVRQLLTNSTPVFLDIYTDYASGVFSGYLGSSSSSVTFESVPQNTDYTLNFAGITLSSSTKYWFVFSEDNLDGDVSNFRLKVNTSGLDTASGAGKGYLVGDTAQIYAQNDTLQDWASAYVLDFTPIPEPSTFALGLAGLVTLLILRSRKG